MKRKSLNKVLALALASAMVMGLAACGGSDDSDAAATGSATTQSSAEAASGTEASTEETASAERQHITFSAIDLNAGVNNSGDYAEEILQQIKDYTNVDLEIIWYANDALSEKNSLALASPSTMPQIMSWGGTVTGDVVSAAKNGAFIDLNRK